MRFGWLACVACGISSLAAAATGSGLSGVSLQSGPQGTRLTLALDHPVRYRLYTLGSPERVVVDLLDSRLPQGGVRLPAGQGAVGREDSAELAGLRATSRKSAADSP